MLIACTAIPAMLAQMSYAAQALTIELKDVAADRIERQRAAAAGALPLAGTPNVAILKDRLREVGVRADAPMLIRVFKSESELEVWKEKRGTYVLFATYPICHWSGSLGPKIREGDKQTPEGFYTVTRAQARGSMRWPRSLNIGYPNLLEQSQAQTGSHILIHGGCSSVGCFAMTNPVMDEIHELSIAALDGGQTHIPVHVFPFRMTDENMRKHEDAPWAALWANLKEGFDAFEKHRRPPVVSGCNGRYEFSTSGDTIWGPGPIEVCPATLTAIREQSKWLKDVPPPSIFQPPPDAFPPPSAASRNRNDRSTYYNPALPPPGRSTRRLATAAPAPVPGVRCSMKRPSCRKFVALQTKITGRQRVIADQTGPRERTRRSAAARPG
jgi:murein L,D-transpeptidase YafK